MTAATLLSRLECVRKTGRGRWIARCPAHDDSSPSLSIREIDDGKLLVHDFGGCAANDVLESIGLDIGALFPDRPTDHRRRHERRPFPAEDALRALKTESEIAGIVAMRIAYGYAVDDNEFERFMVSIRRISNAACLAGIDDDERRVRDRLQRNRQLAEAA